MIKLNDILHLTNEEIKRTKFRFMVKNEKRGFDPIQKIREKGVDYVNKNYLVHNRSDGISFKQDVIAVGFVSLGNNKWLLTGIVDVVKDRGRSRKADVKYKRGKKFNCRIVVQYHKTSQNGIFTAKTLINDLKVLEILPSDKSWDDNGFPGYNKVIESYKGLKRKLEISDIWRNSLKNVKGVYLITDKKTGRLYVGSAYGRKGILGRWETYIDEGFDKKEKEKGKYPNKKLEEIFKKKGKEYIKSNFQYSILETFSENTPDSEIINRESWWKEALLSRKFGYNAN